MIRLTIILIFTLSWNVLCGQTSLQKIQRVNALNEYVNFSNEGIHGLLIVHRLLENYNQEINKYVDLESYKINNFSNKDLPANIFLDEDNWFYDESPYDWNASILANNTLSPNDKVRLTASVTSMMNTLDKVNAMRFDLENLIGTLDLTLREEQVKVYEKLEQGVQFYEEYYQSMLKLHKDLASSFLQVKPTADELQFPDLYNKLADLYLSQKYLLVALRNKEDENFEQKIESSEAALAAFKNINLDKYNSTRLKSKKVAKYFSNIEEQSEMTIKAAKKYYNTAEVPQEFKQYGKFYFYYNSDMINKFNRYGNGIVFELNNLLDYLDMPFLLFSELPHYFKVIYPKKLEKVDYIAATDNKITSLPSQLKDRDITLSKHKIKVDSLTFTVELYDHMIEDGDIISLSFNGDWILEQMPLTAKPKQLKLKINEEGKNYFLLHAENVGRRPPNTMAVRYTYRGREEQIILKSDLAKSEMIEIIYAPPGN